MKSLLSEYGLELAGLALGALILLIVGITITDSWAVIAGSIGVLAKVVSLGVLFVTIYFFPTLIARKRKHQNLLAIFVLNLCLTPALGVGWIVALVWACLNQKAQT